jgi:hypothetical protein
MQILAMFLVIFSQTLQSFKSVYEAMIFQDVNATLADLADFEGRSELLPDFLPPHALRCPPRELERRNSRKHDRVRVVRVDTLYIISFFIDSMEVAFISNLHGAALCAMKYTIHPPIYEVRNCSAEKRARRKHKGKRKFAVWKAALRGG